MTVREKLFPLAAIATLLCGVTEVANAQTTFTSTGGTISVSDSDTGTQPVNATNGYPSAIIVPSTFTGTVSNITVRLNSFTASATGQGGLDGGVSSLGILLVHKASGKNLELMYGPGDGTVGFSSVTFNIADSATSFMPTDGDNCGSTPVAFPSQSTYTYKPTSYEVGNALNTYSGATGLAINRSGPCFQSTLNTLNEVFDGVTAAGEWDLYVNDNNGFADVSIGSWSLTLTAVSAAGTTTTLSSSLNPSFTSGTNNTTTLTATVSSSSTVNAGTVTFTDNSATIAGCGSVPVSNGSATCQAAFTTQGFHSLAANYSGTSSFGPSSGTLNQFVEFHPVVSGNQFCNTGAITIPIENASGTDTQPYPSVMNVSGYTAGTTVSTVQLALNNTVSFSETVDISMLLVSPDGKALDFFDFIGGGVATSVSSVNFVDGPTGVQAPNGSGGLTNGASYEPTSFRSSTSVPPPSFLNPPSPAPSVPGTFFVAAPGGGTSARTFLEAFTGAAANGAWSLYVYDHGNSNTTSIGGWCLTLTPATGTPTVTTVSGSPNGTAPNGAATGTPVTVTAIVKSGGVAVNKGAVTFTENGAPVAGGPTAAVNVATSGPTQGEASFTTSSLTEGDHTILATYTDSTNSLNESFGTYVQRVDDASTVTVNGTQVSYCNAGAVTFPNGSVGAATPNPSNINVSSLFGTINTLTLTLNGYHESPSASFLESVLVGPAGTKAATLDFFSGAGGASGDGPFNLVFSDAGSSLVPAGTFSGGTYKPTSYNTTDTFTASTSGFYTLPSTYNYSSIAGSSSFGSVYASTSPIGNWDLYFNQSGDSAGGGLNTGWCLNFIENPPALTISKSHNGTFEQGEQGAQFTINVGNSGPGTSGGPIAVKVTDTLPTGLTPAATPGSGTDWSCGAAGQVITCTNSDVVPSGGSYPPLTLNVNVSPTAPGSVSNTASVNGSGNTAAVNSNTDTVTIVAPPSLGIVKTPSGTFTQGQTAVWNLVDSNNATGSTTSGTVTVIDTLPTGYSLNSYSGTGWTCGAITTTVTCTSTTAVAGGSSFPTLSLTVNVPATSPTSVTNNVVTFGGGDPVHTNSGNGATAFSTVPVVQVPATINLTAGNNQSVAINQPFPTNLAVTVLDAGSVAINGVTVTFSAPGTGPSGIFAGGTNIKTAVTNSSGVATATVYTANSTAGGPYTIIAGAGSITNQFSETNLAGTPTQMTANSGTTPQSAPINTAFTNALAVTVKDASNNPVPGVSVTFTAPSTGASGIFSNSTNTITVMTNSSGVASTPLTANATAGAYFVTATSAGLTAVNFLLSNVDTAATVTNVTSTAANGTYGLTAVIPITVAFSKAVNVTGTPQLALNSGGTANYSTGSGTSALTFTYTVLAGQNSSHLDYVSSGALTLNGGTITDASTTPAVLALPTPGTAGSLGANKNLVIDTISPTVVSYNVLWGTQSFNVIGTSRNRLPWQITSVRVVFSKPIATGDVNSLTGVTTSGFSGLGTNTLTWNLSPLALGNFATTLAGSGADALKDAAGNALTGGAGFSQNLKVLYGDFNDDGVVNSQDLVGVNNAISAPYNIFADMNGDGVINITDDQIVRSRIGTSLP